MTFACVRSVDLFGAVDIRFESVAPTKGERRCRRERNREFRGHGGDRGDREDKGGDEGEDGEGKGWNYCEWEWDTREWDRKDEGEIMREMGKKMGEGEEKKERNGKAKKKGKAGRATCAEPPRAKRKYVWKDEEVKNRKKRGIEGKKGGG
ncbi:hypothetical protein ACMFMF_009503 [Clarireedia jacksonii]